MDNDVSEEDQILIAEELSAEDIVSSEKEFVTELKTVGERIMHFLIDVGTSGKYWEEKTLGTSDYLIRYALLNFFTVFGAAILAGFFVANIKMKLYAEAGICFAMFLIAITGFLLARTSVRQIIPAITVSFFYGMFCVGLIWNGEINGANSLSIFVYPLVTIMLLGMYYGILFSLALLFLVAIQLFVPGFSHYEYNFDVASRTVVSYILVLLVMSVIEFSRRTKDSLIRIQHKKLSDLNEQLSCRIRDFDYQPRKKTSTLLKQPKAGADGGFNVKTKGVAHFIPYSEVSHVEVMDHSVYIKMRNKSLIKVNTTFSKMEDQLMRDDRFVKCHRSYIININEIATLAKQTIIMNNGTKVTISRNFSYVKESIEKRCKWTAKAE